jgi:hypothetical protein
VGKPVELLAPGGNTLTYKPAFHVSPLTVEVTLASTIVFSMRKIFSSSKTSAKPLLAAMLMENQTG